MNYISHADWAEAMGFNESDLRITRRVTDCPIRSRRPSRTNVFEVEAVLEWLAKILQRVDPRTEVSIRSAGKPIEEFSR